jgi:transposase-like protein
MNETEKPAATVICPRCGTITSMLHLHSTAHGIEGTHMDGSEHFKCSSCGYTLSRLEAESLGLQYVLDVEARSH